MFKQQGQAFSIICMVCIAGVLAIVIFYFGEYYFRKSLVKPKESELARLAALGPSAILRKPFSSKPLVRHLRDIFERKAA